MENIVCVLLACLCCALLNVAKTEDLTCAKKYEVIDIKRDFKIHLTIPSTGGLPGSEAINGEDVFFGKKLIVDNLAMFLVIFKGWKQFQLKSLTATVTNAEQVDIVLYIKQDKMETTVTANLIETTPGSNIFSLSIDPDIMDNVVQFVLRFTDIANVNEHMEIANIEMFGCSKEDGACEIGYRAIDIVTDFNIILLQPSTGGLDGSEAKSAVENFQGKSLLVDNLAMYLVIFKGDGVVAMESLLTKVREAEEVDIQLYTEESPTRPIPLSLTQNGSIFSLELVGTNKHVVRFLLRFSDLQNQAEIMVIENIQMIGCVEVICPVMAKPEYGDVSADDREVGGISKYSCIENFDLIGEDRKQCSIEGVWVPSDAPICVESCKDGFRQIDIVNDVTIRMLSPISGGLAGSVATSALENFQGKSTLTDANLVVYMVFTGDGSSWEIRSLTATITGADLADIQLYTVDLGPRPISINLEYKGNSVFSLPIDERMGQVIRFILRFTDTINQDEIMVVEKIEMLGCVEILCPIPPKPENGNTIGENRKVGDTVEYACNENFELDGGAERQCNSEGKWIPTDPPTCVEILCSTIDTPEDVLTNIDQFTVDGIATFTCKTGFKLEGNSEMVCGNDGNWNGAIPECKEILCPDVIVKNHIVVDVNHFKIGGIARFTCNTGFKLEGNSEIVCGGDGNWIEAIPDCVEIMCTKINAPVDGFVDVNEFTIGGIAKFTCKSGFKIEGIVQMVCGDDGIWVGAVPVCVEMMCPTINALDDGFIDVNEFTIGSVAKFICKPGFKLEGSSEMLCGDEEKWVGNFPICVEIICLSINNPDDGLVDVDKFTTGGIAKFTCKTGFELQGSSQLICDDEGHWLGTFPICVEILCPTINAADAVLIDADEFTIGSLAKFTCKPGYKLVGNNQIVCGDDGIWEGVLPDCVEILCPTINAADEVLIDTDLLTIGSVVKFTCITGFKLEGNSQMVCGDDGIWIGAVPVCVADAVLIDADEFTIGSLAKFTCKPGYTLEGNSQIVCGGDGIWDDVLPDCVEILCPKINTADDVLTDVDQFTIGSSAKFTCSPGFTLEGNSELICGDDGTWVGITPVCEEILCPTINAADEVIIEVKQFTIGSVAKFTCISGFKLEGNIQMMVCGDGGIWVGAVPVCVEITCPIINEGGNILVEVEQFTIGSVAKFNCNIGFKLEGNSQTVCGDNGQWVGAIPECVEILCPKINTADDVLTDVDQFTIGSSAKFTCSPGFTLEGNSELICGDDGTWVGITPACVEILCPTINAEDEVIIEVKQFTIGSVAKFTCISGFKLEGNSQMVCGDGGIWVGAVPVCVEITCPTINEGGNILVDVEQFTIGSVAKFNCNIGFKLEGNSQMVCGDDGQWIGAIPECVEILCPKINTADDVLTDVDQFTIGSLAKFTCSPGFTLEGNSELICGDDGTWVGITPVCEEILCPTINAEDGVIIKVKQFTIGSVAKFTCISGFKLEGNSQMVCGDGGIWVGAVPVCLEITCSTINEGGNILVDVEQFTIGGVAKFNCNIGFKLEGNSQMVCGDDGQWVGAIPECVEILCPKINTADDVLTDVDQSTIGSLAKFTCSPGFMLEGNSELICGDDGTWVGITPVCEEILCPTINAEDEVIIEVKQFTIGSVAKFTCISGFKLEGNSQMVCGDGGIWVGAVPVCVEITCPTINEGGNILVDVEQFTIGSVAKFNCNIGFKLEGNSQMVCGDDGQWIGAIPECVEILCPKINTADDVLTDVDQFTIGSLAKFTCSPGFTLEGNSELICGDDGTWVGITPVCEEILCPTINAEDEVIIEVKQFTIGSVAKFTCISGFKLEGNSQMVCGDGGIWVGAVPVCVEITCPTINEGGNILVDVEQFTIGSVAKFNCNIGFKLEGNSQMVCGDDGQWVGAIPECVEILCPKINTADDVLTDVDQFTIGSSAKFTCSPGFTLEGNSELICGDDGTWVGITPACVEIQCPTLEPPEHGSVNIIGNNIGNKAIFTCNTGFELVGEDTLYCNDKGNWDGETSLTCNVQGNVIVGGFTVGNTATFSCNEGFELEGDDMLLCGENGNWIGTYPNCIEIPPIDPPAACSLMQRQLVIPDDVTFSTTPVAGDLSDPLSPFESIPFESTTKSAVYTMILTESLTLLEVKVVGLNIKDIILKYRQSMAFLHIPPVTTESDNVEIRWSGTEQEVLYLKVKVNRLLKKKPMIIESIHVLGCLEIVIEAACPEPDVPGGSVASTNSTNAGGTTIASCPESSQMIGDQIRKCELKGEWSGVQPQCVTCPTNQRPLNVQRDLIYTKIPHTGSLPDPILAFRDVTIWCPYGPAIFVLNTIDRIALFGISVTSDDADEVQIKWKKNMLPVHITPTSNGVNRLATWSGMLVTSFIKINIYDWDDADGDGLIEIKSIKVVGCIKLVECPVLVAPENGKVDMESTFEGSLATFSCNDGYDLDGWITITCGGDGKWSSEEPPVCTKVGGPVDEIRGCIPSPEEIESFNQHGITDDMCNNEDKQRLVCFFNNVLIYADITELRLQGGGNLNCVDITARVCNYMARMMEETLPELSQACRKILFNSIYKQYVQGILSESTLQCDYSGILSNCPEIQPPSIPLDVLDFNCTDIDPGEMAPASLAAECSNADSKILVCAAYKVLQVINNDEKLTYGQCGVSVKVNCIVLQIIIEKAHQQIPSACSSRISDNDYISIFQAVRLESSWKCIHADILEVDCDIAPTDEARCSMIYAPNNGKIIGLSPASTFLGEGFLVEFSCDDYYYLRGSSTISCKTDGRWSASPPFCRFNEKFDPCDTILYAKYGQVDFDMTFNPEKPSLDLSDSLQDSNKQISLQDGDVIRVGSSTKGIPYNILEMRVEVKNARNVGFEFKKLSKRPRSEKVPASNSNGEWQWVSFPAINKVTSARFIFEGDGDIQVRNVFIKACI